MSDHLETCEFSVGSKVVYPTHGVAEIVGVEDQKISGRIQKFYVLQVLGSSMKILVAVDKAAQVGVRSLCEPTLIKDIYELLREDEIRSDSQTWNRRYRGFMDKIKTGSLYEVAEVFRDLNCLKYKKTLSFGERRMLDQARLLIVQEISVVLGRKMSEVEQDIDACFEKFSIQREKE